MPSFKVGAICSVLAVGLAVLPGHAQDNDPRLLTFLDPVQGTLTDADPSDPWTFEGYADQIVSVIATTIDGSLDPVIIVIGPDGTVIAENDDLDSLVTDAGLEAFALPQDGLYTVRVSRYDDSTAGTYQLTLTPGFAHIVRRETFDNPESPWNTSDDVTAVVTQNRLRARVLPAGTTALVVPADSEPLADLYMQASAELFGQVSYAEFGLVFRVQTAGTGMGMLAFKANTEGRWTVSVQDASGEFTLRTWTANEALNTSTWTLSVLARGSDFSFFANGVLLGTVSDDRLPGPGDAGLVVATRSDQPDPATVLFDDVIMTTRLGTTYQGLPLALTSWNDNVPALIATELAESGQVDPAANYDLFVLERSLRATDPESLFDLVGSAQAVYSDFIFGANLTAGSTESDAGCGIVYRWQDERNLNLTFFDTSGGFGIVQAQDAALTTNVYAASDMITDGVNKIIVVVQAERVALYINGALVAQEATIPGSGRVGVALLNYEDAITTCAFGDLWVWPLAADGIPDS